jgi:hypothetical protein
MMNEKSLSVHIYIYNFHNMKKVATILINITLLLSCNKEKIQVAQEYEPRATVSFYDNETGKKINPGEVSLGNMRSANGSYAATFNKLETLKVNDTGAVSFKHESYSAALLVSSDLYVGIPYSIDGWRFPANNNGTIPASLTSKQDDKYSFRVNLFKKAVTSIRIKQVSEYAPSLFRIFSDTYKSTDTSETNKLVRASLVPEAIYLRPGKLIDTTIMVNLPGNQYTSFYWELFDPSGGWSEFFNKYLGKLDAKKYSSDNRHEILITF